MIAALTKSVPAVGVLLLCVASGLAGQGRAEPGAPPGGGMMGSAGPMDEMPRVMGQGMMGGGMEMMPTGGPGPEAILRMSEALNLTDAQRTALRDIQRRQLDAAGPLMTAMMQARREAAAALDEDSPSLETYEQALRDAAEQMVGLHMVMVHASLDARAVLTDEQRRELEAGLGIMREMMGPQGQGPQGQGMMGGRGMGPRMRP